MLQVGRVRTKAKATDHYDYYLDNYLDYYHPCPNHLVYFGHYDHNYHHDYGAANYDNNNYHDSCPYHDDSCPYHHEYDGVNNNCHDHIGFDHHSPADYHDNDTVANDDRAARHFAAAFVLSFKQFFNLSGLSARRLRRWRSGDAIQLRAASGSVLTRLLPKSIDRYLFWSDRTSQMR